MSEKAVAIASYFVASGIDVILGQPFHISGSENVSGFMNQETHKIFNASFHYESEPMQAVEKIMKIIENARNKLGINKKFERKMYDMRDRRAINV